MALLHMIIAYMDAHSLRPLLHTPYTKACIDAVGQPKRDYRTLIRAWWHVPNLAGIQRRLWLDCRYPLVYVHKGTYKLDVQEPLVLIPRYLKDRKYTIPTTLHVSITPVQTIELTYLKQMAPGIRHKYNVCNVVIYISGDYSKELMCRLTRAIRAVRCIKANPLVIIHEHRLDNFCALRNNILAFYRGTVWYR